MENLPDSSIPEVRTGQKLKLGDIVFRSGFRRADKDAAMARRRYSLAGQRIAARFSPRKLLR